MIALGYAMAWLPPGKMLELSAAIIVLSVGLKLASKGFESVNTEKLIEIAAAMVIFGIAMIPLAYAMSLMKGVGFTEMIVMAVMLGVMTIALKALAKVGPMAIVVAVAFVIFSAALLITAYALRIAAEAFQMLNEVDLLGLAGGLLAFAGAALVLLPGAIMFYVSSIFIGWGLENILGAGVDKLETLSRFAASGLVNLATGMEAIANASYIRFHIGSKFTKWGLQNLMEGIEGASDITIGMMQVLGPGLVALARGMEAIVGAPYGAFKSAAKEVAAGLIPLVGVASIVPTIGGLGEIVSSVAALAVGIGTFADVPAEQFQTKAFYAMMGLWFLSFALAWAGPDFAWGFYIAASLMALNTAIQEFGPAGGFRLQATYFKSALGTIALGLRRYASYVEDAANRVVMAVSKTMSAASWLDMFGLDEVVKSSAAISVKTELEDKREESEFRESQTDLLEGIKNGIATLTEKVENISATESLKEGVDNINKLLATWLPDIAEDDKGLSTATNRW